MPPTLRRFTAELHPNVKLVTQAIEAFNKNDFETLKQLMSEDFVYRVYGRGPMAGTCRGHRGFKRIMDVAKDVINVAPLVVLADDEHVFVLARLNGKSRERSLDTENCYLYRVKDGKVVEGRNIPTDQHAFDEFSRYIINP